MTAQSDKRTLFVVPILVWIGLMIDLAATLAYAAWPLGPLKPVVALLISASMAGLMGFFFMKLSKASPLIRLTAAGAFLWIMILFGLAFADYLTRP